MEIPLPQIEMFAPFPRKIDDSMANVVWILRRQHLPTTKYWEFDVDAPTQRKGGGRVCIKNSEGLRVRQNGFS